MKAGVRSKNKSCLVFLGSRAASWERSSSTWTDRLSFLWEDQQHSRASSPNSETPTHTHTHAHTYTHNHTQTATHSLLLWFTDTPGSLTTMILPTHIVRRNSLCIQTPFLFLKKMFLSFTRRTHQSHDVGQDGSSKACAAFRACYFFFCAVPRFTYSLRLSSRGTLVSTIREEQTAESHRTSDGAHSY